MGTPELSCVCEVPDASGRSSAAWGGVRRDGGTGDGDFPRWEDRTGFQERHERAGRSRGREAGKSPALSKGLTDPNPINCHHNPVEGELLTPFCRGKPGLRKGERPDCRTSVPGES